MQPKSSFYCWEKSDFVERPAGQLRRQQEIALPHSEAPLYGTVLIDSIIPASSGEQSVTIFYTLPAGADVSHAASIQIERVDLTQAKPVVKVAQTLAIDASVLVFQPTTDRMDEVWGKPPTLFVMGTQQLTADVLAAICKEAHIRAFGQIIYPELPQIYGDLKHCVQTPVSPHERTYLYVDWWGLHIQARRVQPDPLPALKTPEFFAQNEVTPLGLMRASQYPEVCTHMALFLAEKTGKMPVLISALRNQAENEDRRYTAYFPDPD